MTDDEGLVRILEIPKTFHICARNEVRRTDRPLITAETCNDSSRVNGVFISSPVRTQSADVMKYFELEEKRLKNLLKTEKQWGKEEKEGEEVRCTKHLGTEGQVLEILITLVTDKTATRYLFKGKSVVCCSETLHVI